MQCRKSNRNLVPFLALQLLANRSSQSVFLLVQGLSKDRLPQILRNGEENGRKVVSCSFETLSALAVAESGVWLDGVY